MVRVFQRASAKLDFSGCAEEIDCSEFAGRADADKGMLRPATCGAQLLSPAGGDWTGRSECRLQPVPPPQESTVSPFNLRHVLAAVLVVAVVLPASSLAGAYFNLGFGLGCGGCGFSLSSCLCAPCLGCRRPPMGCACPPPAPVCPPAGPVFQSSYVPQQFVSYEDVPRVEYRRQAFTEQVPVTTYEQVAETVYVPQQVMRTVPRTVLTEQTRYRDVAFQTTERIARTHTRMIPRTTIGFAPVRAPGGCSSCGETSFGHAPMASPAYPSVLPTAAPTIMAPSNAAIPSMPTMSVSPYGVPNAASPHGAHGAVPQYDDVNWSNVRPRSAPTPSSSHAPVRGASMFRPAPSAATVWRSRF